MDLLTNPTFLWLIATVVFLVLEFIIPGVLVIFFSFGALVLMFLTWIFPQMDVNLQLILFLVISVLALILLRRRLKTIFHGKKSENSQSDQNDELIGKSATVTAAISPKAPGRVLLNGTEWTAESNQTCAKGDRVKIIGHESLTLHVNKES